MTMMIALIALQTTATGTAEPATLSGAAESPPAARSGLAPAVPPPGTRIEMPVTTSPRVAAPAPTAPHPDRAHVLAAVNAEWRRYDVHAAGRLGPLEFATWVMRANGASVAAAGIAGAPGVKPISAMNATARAFARADANHDGGVTPEEMTDFLMR